MIAAARRRAVIGWVLFDWAAQPFFTLVTTFIYAPYFVVYLAGDPVRGQTIWGYTVAAAGLVVALAGPLCGAIADRHGARKYWVAGASVLLVAMLALFIADGDSGRTLAGLKPLFGLDEARFEGARFSGPFSALWYIVFVMPLFAFVPGRSRAMKLGAAIGSGASALKATLGVLVTRRGEIGRFLVARMFYADGLAALFAFGGAYAAAVFGWQASEVGLFGIVLIIAAALGAWAGGHCDDLLGSRRTVLISIAILIAAVLAILSVDRNHLLFVVETEPAGRDGLFASWPERAYLGLGSVIGLVSGPVQSASRSLLVRLAPAGEMAEYFGLYAFSGKATVFAGPLLVGAATALSGDLRLGFSVIAAFLAVGGVLLWRLPGR